MDNLGNIFYSLSFCYNVCDRTKQYVLKYIKAGQMKEKSCLLPLFVLIMCVAGLGFLAYDVTPKDKIAKVVKIQWLTITNVYEKILIHEGNWYFSPKKAMNIECYEKNHGYQYCYCNESIDRSKCKRCPINDLFCEYDTPTWTLLESIDLIGSDYFPQWPDIIVAGDNQRIDAYIRFEVLFKTGMNEIEIYKPDDLPDFKKFIVGDMWKIKPNHQGSSIKPIKITK